MRLIGEPGIKRDGRERYFTIAQAFARKLDPHSPLFLGNAAMVNAAEDRRDALGRLSDFRREIFERQARAEAFADEAFDAVEPARPTAIDFRNTRPRKASEELQDETLNGQRRARVGISELGVQIGKDRGERTGVEM